MVRMGGKGLSVGPLGGTLDGSLDKGPPYHISNLKKCLGLCHMSLLLKKIAMSHVVFKK